MRSGAPDCATAAVSHAFGETVEYGLVALVFGAVVFALHTWWLGRLGPTPYDALLRRLSLAIGAVIFLAGASLFLPVGIAIAISGSGFGGRPILLGLAAAVFLLAYAALLRRDLRPA